MIGKLGVISLVGGMILSSASAFADTGGALESGKEAGVKDAVSYQANGIVPYLWVPMLGALAGLAAGQGDGAIGGCVGLPGCTPPVTTTTTTTPPTTTTKTATTTTTTKTTGTTTTSTH